MLSKELNCRVKKKVKVGLALLSRGPAEISVRFVRVPGASSSAIPPIHSHPELTSIKLLLRRYENLLSSINIVLLGAKAWWIE
jgi:hypothetical protein